MQFWLVIYQTNLGFVHAWLCKAVSAQQAATLFERIGTAEHASVKCVVLCEWPMLEMLFTAYEAEV